MCNGVLKNCYQLGFYSNPNATIVQTCNFGGGLVGMCSACSILQSGVERGKICASRTQTGGAVGVIFQSPSTLSEVYLTSNVSVIGISCVGGMVGSIAGTVNISNSYSQALVSTIGGSNGELFGYLSVNLLLNIDNGKDFRNLFNWLLILFQVYVDSLLSTGVDGILFGDNQSNNLKLNCVLYTNYSSLPAFAPGSVNLTTYSGIFSFPNSSSLENFAAQNFSQCIWDGFKLRSQYNYSAKFVFF